MNRMLPGILFFALIAILSACNSNSDSKSTQNTSENSTIPNVNKPIFRKVEFGMTKREVQKIETAELVNSSAGSIDYTIDINKAGFADIIYGLDTSGKVNKIEFTVYLDDTNNAESIYSGLRQQFDDDYQSITTSSWVGKQNNTDFQVYLRQSKSKTAPGVYAVWEKI